MSTKSAIPSPLCRQLPIRSSLTLCGSMAAGFLQPPAVPTTKIAMAAAASMQAAMAQLGMGQSYPERTESATRRDSTLLLAHCLLHQPFQDGGVDVGEPLQVEAALRAAVLAE